MNDARFLRQLKKLPLLQSLDTHRWENLTPHIAFRELAEGDVLFSAGRESENLFVVIDGEIGLSMPCADGKAHYYLQSRKKGDTAGDFAVLNGGEHLVTATALRKSRLATFPRFAFELLTGIDPGILAYVYDVAADLSRRVTLARVFLELFGDVNKSTMDELLDVTSVHHFKSGEVLFEENQIADGLYIVVSGRLLIETVDINGNTQRIAEVRAPETVGELALLAETNRSATVVAARESTVAKLSMTDFETLIAPRAEMLMSLSKLVVRRHVANARQEHTQTADQNFIVIPLDKRLPLRRFLHQLKREMREIGSTLTLDARGFDTLYGKSGASQTAFTGIFNSAIAEWLDDKENRFDSLVYLADDNWSAWTRRCVNRADRILLLANAGDENDIDVSLRAVELELKNAFATSRIRPRVDLVLLHPANRDKPSNTAAWLNARRLDSFHHIRIDDPQHFGRLARRLCGKARGIVFSGGGARGYAHLGVQKLLEEQNLAIDYIGGSSMGGLLGASMAMGHSYTDIRSLSATFANKKALFDYTLPLASLMKSQKLTRFCKDVYRDTRIEDLWIPFFCVSSNLADGREVLHDRGLLWKVVRSTISIPGVFSPVPTPSGDLLIDGAVLNTFPVDIMHQRLGGNGNIIGVNVSHIPEQFHYYAFDTTLSGWQVLLSRLNPFTPSIRIPRIAETLLRSTDIKSIERLNETRALLDILIEPDVRAISLLEFKSYQRISEIGYAAAVEVFKQHGLYKTTVIQTEEESLPAIPAVVPQAS